ncbi:uncharacterized protein LOC141616811 [Silene latifolia]|uniref:uncharacterized protein LOC141616811 n=1 Tax=Silene latifolia TaxID=37657 RepID=UPI003D783CF2
MAMCSRTLTSTFINLNGGTFTTTKTSKKQQSTKLMLSINNMSSSSSSSNVSIMEAYEEGKLERPKWSGETPLSRLVGALISFKPLYSIMKFGARQALISTAEKTNIPWREMTRELLESEVYQEMETVRNPDIVYPDYYLNPFHAYDEGNLSWLAAAEAEAATLSVTMRAMPEVASVEEAMEIVRGNWILAVEKHHQQYSGNSTVQDILDIGCSVGISTKFLANKFPSANITGLDLSPYFLAVAKFKEKNGVAREKRINWLHANGEDTRLPSNSFDLVSIAYVLHECPAKATVNLVKEAFRLLRPGGTIAITDNSPKSKKLQELSPVLFTLMKSTEPFLDEYYLLDLEGAMREIGFIHVHTVLTDPRHRTVTATVPFPTLV